MESLAGVTLAILIISPERRGDVPPLNSPRLRIDDGESRIESRDRRSSEGITQKR